MGTNSSSATVARRAFYGALSFFVLSLIFMGGYFYSGDAEAYFTVAFELAQGRLPGISERLAGYGVRGTAGLLYAKFGLGFSLVLMPFVWVTLLVASLFGAVLTGPVLYASAHLAGPILGGAGVYLFHVLQHRLGIARRARFAGTLFFSLGGLWLVYSRFLFSELFAGVLLLAVLYGSLSDRRSGDWLLAFATGLLFLTRLETLALTGPVVLVRWWKTRRTTPYVICFAVAVGVFGWYNWLRFGRPFYTGMGNSAVEAFSTPVLVGLTGQFFAPGNGLFLYAPFLVPALVVSAYLIVRTGLYKNPYLLAWGVGITVYVLIHSAWHSWMGGWSWGPRRMIPLLGLIHLSVGLAWSRLSSILRGVLWVLLPVSLVVNLAGLIGNFNDYYRGTFYQKDVLFAPEYAQLVAHNLGLIFGEYSVDVFWLKVLGLNDGLLVISLLLLSGGLLLREFIVRRKP